MSARVLLRERPNRAIALATSSHVLIFRHVTSSGSHTGPSASTTSVHSSSGSTTNGPRCVVELSASGKTDLSEYKTITYSVHGTLGLITVENDVFLCVVSGTSKAATVRPGENIQKIGAVDFHCLNSSEHDHLLHDDINLYNTDTLDEDGFEHDQHHQGRKEGTLEHPCLALRKLLSGGSFYYSVDFDLTNRIQDRSEDASTFDFDTFDKAYLWNSYMIKPLIDFRSRLSSFEREALDSTRLLTSAIRGFASTITVPASSSPARSAKTGLPSTLTLISRLSCKRAGTRFNARGIDDDGNVANFVETETVFWSPSGTCLSYVQIRGSIPLFWEQAPGLLPGQQKITLTRSAQATQPAFDKHFEELMVKYGNAHIVNLLSNEKQSEIELSSRYRNHVGHSSLNSRQDETASSDHGQLQETDYDFHAETRGPGGYQAAIMIRQYIQDSVDSFGYCLTETSGNTAEKVAELDEAFRSTIILQQQGVFRTNCLDCLDRTNLIQTIISHLAFEAFCGQRGEKLSPDVLARHGSLWADNGDALSRIYAGTGALKSSFTRHGKMSFAGALADARKTATRMYINNFADKGRQTTMDMLLGRLMGQAPVYLFDPINDFVTSELSRRSLEFTSSRDVKLWVGSFNLNGRSNGINSDLSPWLFPSSLPPAQLNPDIVAVGFQEIVELSPQQIMATDPSRRQAWEKAVKRTLNAAARARSLEEYVLLRGGQLVGASLSIFVKVSLLPHIKNVEGSLKKTGMSGAAGNKGAVAIRIDLDATSICFVTAHLAAGFSNYEERNRDYWTISQGLRFPRHGAIEDHDAVIWLGDFNYRIGLSHEKAKNLAANRDYERLYENDQLNLQMVAGLTFPHFSEYRLLFPPTYKYDLNTDNYDSSEKARIPAWTDRILSKSKGNQTLRQLSYSAAQSLRFSDHRPVYATFTASVRVINEAIRDRLSKELYAQRLAAIGRARTNSRSNADTLIDDLYSTSSRSSSPSLQDRGDDLLSLANESGKGPLPPASSERSKWWLDGGMPARSALQPPLTNGGASMVPNPQRPANPFGPTDKPGWIPKGAANGGAPALPSRHVGVKLEAEKPVLPSRPADPRASSTPSSTPGSAVPTRKPTPAQAAPPPVPRKKPELTASSLSRPTSTVAISAQQRAKSPGGKSLMDDDDGFDAMGGGVGGGGMSGWAPLKPS
ncbi:MAG: inositol polyphosphate 5-phosphatase [Chrysothrix sp. TS-e1954]|nr:MAG: inositol polyphosphate 5-phosphatase [Chrysothrix sp. TS-e1954]